MPIAPASSTGGPPAGTAASASSFAQWLRQRVGSASDPDVIHLFESTVPEPSELLRAEILDAFADGMPDSYRSTFSGGHPIIRARLARQYGVSGDHVLPTTGANAAISMIYRSVLGSGGRLLIENPAFDLFAHLATPLGIAVDRFERCAPDYRLDIARIAAALRPETRLVVVSNLHNPSGMAVDAETMRALGQLAQERDFLVLVDEVYAPFAKGAVTAAASLGSDRLISVSSMAKAYGLGTLRCGWIVAHPDTLDPIRRASAELDFNVSDLSHALAARILEHPDPFLKRTFAYLEEARPLVERFHAFWRNEGLIEGHLPEFGCIALCHLPGVGDARIFADWLEQRHGVAVVPGEYFGAKGGFRLGFGIDRPILEDGLTRLTDGLIEYRRAYAEKSVGP